MGDSVLKFLTVYHLISCSGPDISEGALTHLKGRLVSNDRLSKLGVDNFLFLYLRTKNTAKKNWRPAFVEDNKNADIKIRK